GRLQCGTLRAHPRGRVTRRSTEGIGTQQGSAARKGAQTQRGRWCRQDEGVPATDEHPLEVERFGSAGDHSPNWSSNLPFSTWFLIAVRKRAASAPSISRWS